MSATGETFEQEDLDGEDYDEDEEEGYEFGDADDAMQCVEMAERSGAAAATRVLHSGTQIHDALAGRKRKALAEEQPEREECSKNPRQDELSEVEAATMFDQLMEGFGLRRKRRSRKEEEGKEQGISSVLKSLKNWVMPLCFLRRTNLKRQFLYYMRLCGLHQICQIHIIYLEAFIKRTVN